MRRFLTPPLALLAGLVVLLTACAGESPTAPQTPPGGGNGGGNCATSITLATTSDNPFAGGGTFIRATVRRNGAPVADGTSVQFTTDLGFFFETGLQTVSKTTSGGVAEVTLGSAAAGAAHVKATIECATATLSITFKTVPGNTPFISSIFPTTGSCLGGDTITINGGKFGSNVAGTRVTFGGKPATVVSVSDTQIIVLSPVQDRPANEPPDQRDAVDVVVTLGVNSGTPFTITQTKGFSYFCTVNRIFISSVIPNSGSPAGGETVTINGGNFGTNVATTRVTFCGVSATIVSMSDTTITVLTPRHQLQNPTVSETCDVGVTINLGLVTQQSAVLPQAFTYRGTTTGGECATSPAVFISTLTPNTGGGEGGTSVTITGGGFVSDVAHTRVEFGGVPGTVTAVSPGSITVLSPAHALANPNVPEPVAVRVIVDLGGQNQTCATLANGFIYTQTGLQPAIFSVSPRTGPNDASTRVTIFGTNFQFPLQVFVTAGGCRIEASVVSIKFNEVVFLTPIALNGNNCLANQTVDITVVNPYTGKQATCPECFKYYPCPTVSSSAPNQGPYLGGTRITINGQNFEEPVAVTVAGVPATVVQVSSSGIVAVTNEPLNLTCNDVSGSIVVTSDALSCGAVSGGSFTYIVKALAPTITGITGGPAAQDGTTQLTITGTNFIDPNMQVIFTFAGPKTVTVTPTIVSSTTMTVTAPAFQGTFTQKDCTTTSGTPGTMSVDTAVPVTVKNGTTTCTSAPVDVLYHPTDTSCVPKTALAITSGALPDDVSCGAYSFTFTATGGNTPYTWSVIGAPGGFGIDPNTGVFSGTPTVNGSFTFSVEVKDSSTTQQVATKSVSLTISGCP